MPTKKKRELKRVTITHVSVTGSPANRLPFYTSKAEGEELTGMEISTAIQFAGLPTDEATIAKLAKNETEEQLLYGIVYEPDTPDAVGDFMSEESIRKACHSFADTLAIDTEHDLFAGVGKVVETWITPVEFTAENGKVIKKGTWLLTIKANDATWKSYKEGKIIGFSMYGIARDVVEVEKSSMMDKVRKFLGVEKSFQETVDETIDNMKSNPSFIMDMLRRDFWNKVDWDSTNIEDLNSLSVSMTEAVDYIKGVIKMKDEKVQKNEDGTPAVETPVVETPAVETPPTPEAIQKSTIEAISKSVVDAVSKAFDTKIETIETSFNEKIEAINKRFDEVNGTSVVVEKPAGGKVEKTVSYTEDAGLLV